MKRPSQSIPAETEMVLILTEDQHICTVTLFLYTGFRIVGLLQIVTTNKPKYIANSRTLQFIRALTVSF
jgi:hypothetical protein